jgi:hypothetical protein
VSGVQAEVQKDKAVAQPQQEEQPATVAANEPPPPKSTPEATVEQVPKAADVEVSKKEVREKEAAAPQAGKAMRAERDKDNFTRARKSPDSAGVQGGAIASGQRNSAGFMSIGRTVAGRQFRKEGGVWIDTGYDSSKDVVTLTRGSEQYRALVADEPSIKTIADTLPGEIIVVWKGHTYRIH